MKYECGFRNHAVHVRLRGQLIMARRGRTRRKRSINIEKELNPMAGDNQR